MVGPIFATVGLLVMLATFPPYGRVHIRSEYVHFVTWQLNARPIKLLVGGSGGKVGMHVPKAQGLERCSRGPGSCSIESGV